MAEKAVAEFVHVVKDYPIDLWGRRTLRAVDDVTLSVAAGEVFGLLGPNRAGKTTLVKILLSLCRPTSGEVRRLGQPLSDRSTLARIGYMHENHAFPRYLTAAGLLEYYAALTLVPYEKVRDRLPRLLKKVELHDRSREPIARFSKGMIQRLGLAQALLNEPELLVLDEPTEGLDLAGRQLLRDVVEDQRRKGRTTLLVSHVLTEVEQLCDRVAVIVQGRLVHVGPVRELTRDPVTGEARAFEQAIRELYAKSPS
ncbi:MAG: ABC transporter ATP-binding protein [Gemmataceae bacterium]|nr:ABC transporter ATP-binding protein [Gemmataceae bacterium]MDW8264516.1 ABC transporter ATP-binding protein [Gemmataceae bacterium]